MPAVSDTATLVAAIVGAGGAGMFIREVFSGIGKITSGVSGRENTRKNDLVLQRKQANARADAFEHNADVLRDNWELAKQTISELKGKLLERGYPLHDLPSPVYEATLSRAAIEALVADVEANGTEEPAVTRDR